MSSRLKRQDDEAIIITMTAFIGMNIIIMIITSISTVMSIIITSTEAHSTPFID